MILIKFSFYFRSIKMESIHKTILMKELNEHFTKNKKFNLKMWLGITDNINVSIVAILFEFN